MERMKNSVIMTSNWFAYAKKKEKLFKQTRNPSMLNIHLHIHFWVSDKLSCAQCDFITGI